jgi:co-chaperonin GroES (HSP10)
MSFSAIETDARASDQAQKLQPRLIKGMQADYIPVFWEGENPSGLRPYGPNVLVKMDPCATASAGGVLLVDEMVDRMNEASVTGCIVAMGPEAFAGLSDRPQVGHRIYIEKYAGTKARGMDGALYRAMDDSCVVCGIGDDATQVEG